MELDRNTLRKMIWDAVTFRPDELNCQQCFDHLDHFAELSLVGKSAAEAMPLVHDHLERCTDCREEFEALLGALQALQSPAADL
jgi:predicted anti-sigma-YlaC factor YlaD